MCMTQDVPPEEAFESLASRCRPFFLQGEPIHWSVVFGSLRAFLKQDSRFGPAVEELRRSWKVAEAPEPDTGFAVTRPNEVESQAVWFAALADSWLYGDLVHADLAAQERASGHTLNSRYCAAVLLYGQVAIHVVATLNLIRQAVEAGLLILQEEAFLAPVSATVPMRFPLVGYAQAEVGTPMQAMLMLSTRLRPRRDQPRRSARRTPAGAAGLLRRPGNKELVTHRSYGSIMYPPPDGQDLTEVQALELDDTFLASDPFQYFSSRIASLLAWHESAPVSDAALPEPEPGSIRAELNQYLQRPVADGPFKELDVHAQVAADALAVRHHAAEALLRLACARLAPSTGTGAPCLWAEIASGPTRIAEVIEHLNASAQEADPGERMLCTLVEPGRLETARSSPEIVDACNVLVDWLGYAAGLLGPAEIDVQAGHNKVKHGLAVRARSDMRVTFLTTPPNADGAVPLSAFTGPDAIDIFDQPVLELLARRPKVDGHRQGLEITQLRLKPSALLAEATCSPWRTERCFMSPLSSTSLAATTSATTKCRPSPATRSAAQDPRTSTPTRRSGCASR